jgi:hypothetical protein
MEPAKSVGMSDILKKNPVWAALIAILTFVLIAIPQWLGAIWPLLSDKTIPAWLAQRRWSFMNHSIQDAIVLIAMIATLVLLVFLIFSIRSVKKELLDPNQRGVLDALLNQYGQFRNTPIATWDDLSKTIISDKVVFIMDVPRGPNSPVIIEGKRFEGCAILGPAILAVQPGIEMIGCTFLVKGGIETMLFEVPPPGVKVGGIGFRSTSFISCTFFVIGFASDKGFLDYMRQESNKRPKRR